MLNFYVWQMILKTYAFELLSWQMNQMVLLYLLWPRHITCQSLIATVMYWVIVVAVKMMIHSLSCSRAMQMEVLMKMTGNSYDDFV